MAQVLSKTRLTIVRCCGIASISHSTWPFCTGDVKLHEHRCSCPGRATAMGAYPGKCTHLALVSQHFVSEFSKAGSYLNVVTKQDCFFHSLPRKHLLLQKKTEMVIVHVTCLKFWAKLAFGALFPPPGSLKFPQKYEDVQKRTEEWLIDYCSLHLNCIQLDNVIQLATSSLPQAYTGAALLKSSTLIKLHG